MAHHLSSPSVNTFPTARFKPDTYFMLPRSNQFARWELKARTP